MEQRRVGKMATSLRQKRTDRGKAAPGVLSGVVEPILVPSTKMWKWETGQRKGLSSVCF